MITMMEHILENIPDNIRQFTDPTLPREMRMNAASGIIPLLPNDMALVLYVLTLEKDEEIAFKARESLDEIPSSVISAILQDTTTNSGLLDYFARHSEDETTHMYIALNSSTDDRSMAHLARTTHSQQLLEAIAQNHQRIIRSAEIVDALSSNPAASRSTIDSVIDYMKLYLGETSNDQGLGAQDESVDIQEEQGHEEIEESSMTTASSSFLDEAQIDEELIEESEEGVEEDGEFETDDPISENVQFQISMMSIGEKIKIAIMGNGEARRILVRDPNRIVSKAVLSNPRLNDAEILLISKSKVVSDEILRAISDNRKWVKMYPVKFSLVNNPKTPPQVAMNLMKQLRDYDLKTVSRTKNLPGIITTTAKRVLLERRKRS